MLNTSSTSRSKEERFIDHLNISIRKYLKDVSKLLKITPDAVGCIINFLSLYIEKIAKTIPTFMKLQQRTAVKKEDIKNISKHIINDINFADKMLNTNKETSHFKRIYIRHQLGTDLRYTVSSSNYLCTTLDVILDIIFEKYLIYKFEEYHGTALFTITREDILGVVDTLTSFIN